MTKSKFKIALFVLVLGGLALSSPALADWTPPVAGAPTCAAGSPGCDAPLNSGSADQTKTGGVLYLPGLRTTVGATFDNYFRFNQVGGSATGTVLTNTGNGVASWQPSTGGGGFWSALGATGITNTNTGTVVIGTTNNPPPPIDPSDKLEVIGKFYVGGLSTLTSLKLPASAGLGKVLTSDANGLANWQTPATGGSNPVTKIIAGTNVTISPTTGIGDVTINASNPPMTGSGSANYLTKWASATGLTSSGMMYESAGRIGVGTTNPLAIFDVAGTGGFQALGVAGNTNVGGNLNVAGNLQSNTLNNGANSASIIYRTGTNTTVGNNNSALVVQDGGNVGVGTSAPGTRLDVNGVIRTNGDLQAQRLVDVADGSYYIDPSNNGQAANLNGNVVASNSYLFHETGDDTGMVHGNDGELYLRANAVDTVKITNANAEVKGNLELTNPGASLVVNGNNNDSNNLRVYGSTKTDNLCVGSNAASCTNDGFMPGAWCGVAGVGSTVFCKGVDTSAACPGGFTRVVLLTYGGMITCIKN